MNCKLVVHCHACTYWAIDSQYFEVSLDVADFKHVSTDDAKSFKIAVLIQWAIALIWKLISLRLTNDYQ